MLGRDGMDFMIVGISEGDREIFIYNALAGAQFIKRSLRRVISYIGTIWRSSSEPFASRRIGAGRIYLFTVFQIFTCKSCNP